MFKDNSADLPDKSASVKVKLEEFPWLESYPKWQVQLILALPFVAMVVDIFS